MAPRKIVIIGAGGFAREVRWAVQEIEAASRGSWEFAGFVVSDIGQLGPRDSRDEVIGDLEFLRAHRSRFSALAMGIGTPAPRLKIARELEPEFDASWWPALIHPSVRFDRSSSTIGHGTIFCAGAVGTVNLRVAPFSLVNLSCTLGHEAVIGRGSVLNPSVNISGGVELGEGVLVGTGAQILQYLKIGAGASIGAGAVVTRDVPVGETVVGVPARTLQPRPRESHQ